MKHTFALVVIVLMCGCGAHRVESIWDLPKGSEMRAYYTNWNDWEGDHLILTDDYSLSKEANPQNETVISRQDAVQILEWVKNHEDSGFDIFCWMPHHAFVVYDKHGKAMHGIDVCFQCKQYRSTIEQNRKVADLTMFADVLTKHGFVIENPDWQIPHRKNAQQVDASRTPPAIR